jgi:hypothetical protein
MFNAHSLPKKFEIQYFADQNWKRKAKPLREKRTDRTKRTTQTDSRFHTTILFSEAHSAVTEPRCERWLLG